MTAPMSRGPRSCKPPWRGELLAYAEEAEARERLAWARIQGLGFPTERALHVYGNATLPDRATTRGRGGLHERAGERPRLALCFSAEGTYKVYHATQKRYQPGHAARFCKVPYDVL